MHSNGPLPPSKIIINKHNTEYSIWVIHWPIHNCSGFILQTRGIVCHNFHIKNSDVFNLFWIWKNHEEPHNWQYIGKPCSFWEVPCWICKNIASKVMLGWSAFFHHRTHPCWMYAQNNMDSKHKNKPINGPYFTWNMLIIKVTVGKEWRDGCK